MDASAAAPASRTRAFLDSLPLDRQAGRQLRRLPQGGVVGDWFGWELSSVFQPIVEPQSRGVVGFEAYLRILGGGQRDLSPWTLFSANATDERLIALDRLTRTLHALNFVTSVSDDSLLFLSVHGRLLAAVSGDHGSAFRRVVDALGLPAERIVIEAPLAASAQPDLLAFVMRNYRLNGFRTAVNVDSPAQWQTLAAKVPADFIKIDGAKLASIGDAAERLPDPARLVITRLESTAPAHWQDRALVQGYAFGLPAARVAIAAPERFALRAFAL